MRTTVFRLYRLAMVLLPLALLVLLLFTGDIPNKGITSGGGDESQGRPIPGITRRPIPTNVRLTLRPEALPQGARALFPSFDGDSFFVSVSPQQSGRLPANRAFYRAVIPMLRAIGFNRSLREITLPAGEGQPLPKANLAGLTRDTCLELVGLQQYGEICAVMQGLINPTPQIERIFQNGEGMSFQQFKADLERQRIQYVFLQRFQGVPIEHAGIIASRWEGETVTTVHGSVFNQFVVANKVALTPNQAALRALTELLKVDGVVDVQKNAPGRVELLLLPDGGARDGSGVELPALRYSYRMLILGAIAIGTGTAQRVERASWLLWLDAETGAILQLVPQFAFTSARGETWRRAPDTPTQVVPFEVNPAVGGQYTLTLSGVFNRIDRLGDGDFDDGEVSISDSAGGSSSTLANFDQFDLNDDPNAICASLGNNTYRQVNAFAQLYRLRQRIINAGTFPTFPEAAITVWVDSSNPGGNNASYDYFGPGMSRLEFVNGSGFLDASCPDAAGLPLNGAQDPTSMGHEFAHLSTPRLQDRRPADWCPTPPCPIPWGRTLFHDFADHVAHAYASTNCQAGWSRKNIGGAGANLNCAGTTSEGGGLPRRAKVSEGTLPSTPGEATDQDDHFPEHRMLATGDYADGQIAAAALWEVRKGMRSKCLPSGTPQYFVRFTRALWDFGFLEPATTCTDGQCNRDIYRYLQDMLKQMVVQWAASGMPGGPPGFAHNGAHTTNKVTAGFARTGLFLTPYQCIDGDGGTTDPSFCPGGENGGDAIVDINDNDPGDDVTIDGIVHPEVDYLEASGGPPTFHSWTGPRYRFDAVGGTTFSNPCPCNTQFQVEVANDADFTMNFITSGFIAVDTDPTTTDSPECYGTWTPTAAQWDMLNDAERIYYRVRTQDAIGGNERISTMPGAGFRTVPPPYAVINATGTPSGVVAHLAPLSTPQAQGASDSVAAYLKSLGVHPAQKILALSVLLLPVGILALWWSRARRRSTEVGL